MNDSTSQLDFREFGACFSEIDRRHPEMRLDVLVLTTQEYHALKREFDAALPAGLVMSDPFRINGLPVEWYPTRKEVLVRASELCDKGKRVGVISDPERPSPCKPSPKNDSPASSSLCSSVLV